MLNGYRIIDADAHVLEPVSMWGNYLDPRFQQFAPTPEMTIAGKTIYHKVTESAGTKLRAQHRQLLENHYPDFLARPSAPDAYTAVLQKMGADIAFLYPTYGLFLWAIDSMPPPLAGAFTRAYNSWLRDFCNYAPEILKGVGAVNFHAPEELPAQLQQIADFGWKAVYIRPNPVKGRLLSDPVYEAFWSECERLNIAVGLHEGTHSHLPTVGSDRFDTRFALHATSHPLEQMMALLALVEGGVLERHPNLRVAFLESGCGWLPYWLWRLDHVYEDLYWEVSRHVTMKPSDYFRRQCFISIEPDEPYLQEVIDYIGSDNLLFGSDYPHIDHKPTGLADTVNLAEKLTGVTVKKILWDNPARFYGL